MGDTLLESITSIITICVTLYLWTYGRRHRDVSTKGWTIILVGFTLMTLGYTVDTFGDFWPLSVYVDDTVFEDLLEKILGEILALSLLGLGLIKWMPALANVDDLKRENNERKNAEKELSKNNSLLSGLLSSIPDAISFKDKNGTYLGCNPAFAKLLGNSEEMIKGKTDRELFSGERTALFRKQDL
ncbi:PAS domain-containing protein [Methanolobus sp. ZRKC3]|uniref:PAS domain-containing protein n=1 Tax=Methanolobus sp. ZRKC3 TaxID=3125786 RepID=UPI003249700D